MYTDDREQRHLDQQQWDRLGGRVSARAPDDALDRQHVQQQLWDEQYHYIVDEEGDTVMAPMTGTPLPVSSHYPT